ncbi:MAG: T9SS type A sorting domain-containing protein [Ignavibacteria bacterium]|nr:T9SS type A sorting domain-containing protein [Ignavibacteria bacterium]
MNKQPTTSVSLLLLVSLLMYHARPAATQPRRVDPLQGAGVFTLFGQMSGREGIEEDFGAKIQPIGDCNGDGLNDWIVSRKRNDTTVSDFGIIRGPEELLLYHGVPGGLPPLESGQRVGLSEEVSSTRYIAHGDWDKDGYLDLACQVRLYNDSSFHNTRGFSISSLVVFWGQPDGKYSVEDTTRLAIGAAAALVICDGFSGDIDMSGTDDLFVQFCAGRAWGEEGEAVTIPAIQCYLGQAGRRWGRDEVVHGSSWQWWIPPVGSLPEKLIDVDCDNAPDLLLFHDDSTVDTARSKLTILYGKADQLFPDSTNIEIINLSGVWGVSSAVFDVTGDDVLDLIVLSNRFAQQRMLVYPGEPGKRLSEVFGDGSAPWAAVPTTNAIHDGFGDLGERLYDLGDVNNDIDGFREIWAWSTPFLLCYNTGVVFDSIVDGYYRLNGTPPRDYANLGDIDGSGETTWAVSQYFSPGTVSFFKSNLSIRVTGTFRRLPHERYVSRCSSTVSVPEAVTVKEKSSLQLEVFPNPSTNEVTVQWNPAAWQHGEQAVIRVTDNLGKEVISTTTPATDGGILWTAGERLPNGTYHITITIQKTTDTATIILQR